MQQTTFSRVKSFGVSGLVGMQLMLLYLSMLWPASATAQTSTLCPTLNATVAYGGSVSINATACHVGFGLGNIATPAVHGTASIGPLGLTQFINYAHNGASGTTDSFVVRDGNSPPNNLILFNITITPPTSAISVSPASLPAMIAGTPFNQTLTSSGGAAPYAYSLSTGALPFGLSLTSAGLLSGTPTRAVSIPSASARMTRSAPSRSAAIRARCRTPALRWFRSAPPPSKVSLSRRRSPPSAASPRTVTCLKPAPSRPASASLAPAW